MSDPSHARTHGPPLFVLPQLLLGAAAIAAFRDEAQALANDMIESCNADPAVMVTNVRTGVDAVLPRLGEALDARPKTRVDWILAMPNLAHAVEYAANNGGVAPTVTREEIDAKYAELQLYRTPALLVAKALASPLFKLLPAGEVAGIEAGQGFYDHGQDGIALASLFRTHEASIEGAHPFTRAHLDAMEAVGHWVCTHVTPSGARAPKPAAVGVSTELRDRLWTLLRKRHAELRKVGIELFGEDGVDAKVPLLLRRVRVAARKDAAEVKEPAAPVVPDTKPANDR